MSGKCKLAVLISGNGSNFQAIVEATLSEKLNGEVVLLLSNKKEAYGLKRAAAYQIPHYVIHNEAEAISLLEQYGADLICLAGFMRVLSPLFVQRFAGRILNIHPSLLPDFPGLDVIAKTWKARVSKTGVTIHYVDEGLDTGSILLQESLPILKNESLESLRAKIHALEHQLYPKAIQIAIASLKKK